MALRKLSSYARNSRIGSRKTKSGAKRKKRSLKTIFHPGEVVGEITLLYRVKASLRASPATRNRWACRCSCGKELVVPQMYFTRANPKTHCGCKFGTIKGDHQRLYSIWTMMRRRCNNDTHISYASYGGRGICVYHEWDTLDGGFEKFFEYIGDPPSDGHTLDRKDSNGHYEPGNLQWATFKEQAQNRRKVGEAYGEVIPPTWFKEKEDNDNG